MADNSQINTNDDGVKLLAFIVCLEQSRDRYQEELNDYIQAIRFDTWGHKEFYPSISCFGRGLRHTKEAARYRLRNRKKAIALKSKIKEINDAILSARQALKEGK